jgi:hypothetical protein
VNYICLKSTLTVIAITFFYFCNAIILNQHKNSNVLNQPKEVAQMRNCGVSGKELTEKKPG